MKLFFAIVLLCIASSCAYPPPLSGQSCTTCLEQAGCTCTAICDKADPMMCAECIWFRCPEAFTKCHDACLEPHFNMKTREHSPLPSSLDDLLDLLRPLRPQDCLDCISNNHNPTCSACTQLCHQGPNKQCQLCSFFFCPECSRVCTPPDNNTESQREENRREPPTDEQPTHQDSRCSNCLTQYMCTSCVPDCALPTQTCTNCIIKYCPNCLRECLSNHNRERDVAPLRDELDTSSDLLSRYTCLECVSYRQCRDCIMPCSINRHGRDCTSCVDLKCRACSEECHKRDEAITYQPPLQRTHPCQQCVSLTKCRNCEWICSENPYSQNCGDCVRSWCPTCSNYCQPTHQQRLREFNTCRECVSQRKCYSCQMPCFLNPNSSACSDCVNRKCPSCSPNCEPMDDERYEPFSAILQPHPEAQPCEVCVIQQQCDACNVLCVQSPHPACWNCVNKYCSICSDECRSRDQAGSRGQRGGIPGYYLGPSRAERPDTQDHVGYPGVNLRRPDSLDDLGEGREALQHVDDYMNGELPPSSRRSCYRCLRRASMQCFWSCRKPCIYNHSTAQCLPCLGMVPRCLTECRDECIPRQSEHGPFQDTPLLREYEEEREEEY